MMRPTFIRRLCVIFFLTLAGLVYGPTAYSAALASDQLIMPLSPSAIGNRFQLSSPVDPTKPVWVLYQLVAVSAASRPEGELVIDAALEGIPVSLGDQFVIFDADDMKQSSSAGTIEKQLAAQIGQRSPQELQEAFGPELYAAYVALNKKEGAILQAAILKYYGPTGNADAVLLATVERSSGIQPMLVSATMGQGDVPAGYAALLNSQSLSPVTRSALALAVLALVLYGASRLRRR